MELSAVDLLRWIVRMEHTHSPFTLVQVSRHGVCVCVFTSVRICLPFSGPFFCTSGGACSVDEVSWGCAVFARFVILFTASILAIQLLQYRCHQYAKRWQAQDLLIVQRTLVITLP